MSIRPRGEFDPGGYGADVTYGGLEAQVRGHGRDHAACRWAGGMGDALDPPRGADQQTRTAFMPWSFSARRKRYRRR